MIVGVDLSFQMKNNSHTTILSNSTPPSPNTVNLGLVCILHHAQLSAFIDIVSSVTTTVTSFALPLDGFDSLVSRGAWGAWESGACDQLPVIDYIPTV